MRENLRPAVIALICVLAIGLAAATLGSPVDPGNEGASGQPSSVDDPEREGPGDVNDLPEVNASNQNEGGDGTQWEYCFEPLEGEGLAVPLLGVTLAVGAVVGTLTTKERGAAAALIVLFPAFIIILLLTGGCDVPPPAQEAGVELMARAANETEQAAEGTDARRFTTPTSLIAILFVVATLGVVAAVYFRDSDEDETPVPDDPAMDDEQRQAKIGSAAGDAADRIEDDAELENEVYRAWAEMAEPLPVDSPETSSPEEFAEAAVGAGIRPDDVRELTDLFEEVRYGTAAATEARERQAVEALRRIERTYGDDVADASGEHSTDRSDDRA